MTLAALDLKLAPGREQTLPLQFQANIPASCYAFVCLLKNEAVAVHLSDQRVTGVLAVCHNGNKAVAKSATQTPPPDSGIDTFEFWTPKRRPSGKNFALRIEPPLACFGVANLTNGFARPTNQPNAWVADFAHEQSMLRFAWPEPQTIARIELCFDTDFDHPMESVLMGHPERVMPFCVRHLVIAQVARVPVAAGVAGRGATEFRHAFGSSDTERLLCEVTQNHQARRTIRFEQPVTADSLEIRLLAPSLNTPAALFAVRCYGPA